MDFELVKGTDGNMDYVKILAHESSWLAVKPMLTRAPGDWILVSVRLRAENASGPPAYAWQALEIPWMKENAVRVSSDWFLAAFRYPHKDGAWDPAEIFKTALASGVNLLMISFLESLMEIEISGTQTAAGIIHLLEMQSKEATEGPEIPANLHAHADTIVSSLLLAAAKHIPLKTQPVLELFGNNEDFRIASYAAGSSTAMN